MRKRALADVKTHLSELVDAVEHRGARFVITRHGKAAAALVPIDALQKPAAEPASARRSRADVERFLASFGTATARDSAVAQLRRDRR